MHGWAPRGRLYCAGEAAGASEPDYWQTPSLLRARPSDAARGPGMRLMNLKKNGLKRGRRRGEAYKIVPSAVDSGAASAGPSTTAADHEHLFGDQDTPAAVPTHSQRPAGSQQAQLGCTLSSCRHDSREASRRPF